MGLDDRLREELSHLAPPTGTNDAPSLLEQLSRRRSRLRVQRRLTTGALAVAVIGGTTVGSWGLFRAFDPSGRETAVGGSGDTIAFSVTPSWPLHFSDRGASVIGTGPFDLPADKSDIYTVRPDGLQIRRVTADDMFERSPTWSPDGSTLAFARYPADVDVSEVPDGGSRASIDFEPDGGIELVDVVESPRPTRVFSGQGAVQRVAWSPDGALIGLIVSGERDIERDGVVEIVGSLVVLDPATGRLDPILVDEPVWGFAWAPDGSGFAVQVGTAGGGGIILIDRAGRTVRELLDRGASQPAWSPDGSRIAFVSRRGDETDIWTIRPDGTELTRLTRIGGNELSPTWSPDGTDLAFVSSGATGGAEDYPRCRLLVAEADGSNVRTVIDGRTFGLCPLDLSWGPPAVRPAESEG